MVVKGFIWVADIVDKIEGKHGLTVPEVESVFNKTTQEALVISARTMTERERKYYAKRER